MCGFVQLGNQRLQILLNLRREIPLLPKTLQIPHDPQPYPFVPHRPDEVVPRVADDGGEEQGDHGEYPREFGGVALKEVVPGKGEEGEAGEERRKEGRKGG